MGKGTIKARKINWLRLFLVKSFRALRRPEYLGVIGEGVNLYSTGREFCGSWHFIKLTLTAIWDCVRLRTNAQATSLTGPKLWDIIGFRKE